YKADNGDKGGASLKDGKDGKDVIIKVPPGTIIRDFRSEKILFDLDGDGKEIILAKGGKGGKGNSNFATSTNQTPRFAEEGKPGEQKKVILELKLIADVGLVGFPNAGKSTLISTVSAARPKIADYPFTTLEPVLGIVKYKDYDSFTIADIPGIIEGAHEGKGLGHKFLRHIERTKIILFLIEAVSENFEKDFDILYSELKNYSRKLTEKKILVAISKADLIDEKEKKRMVKLNFGKDKISPIVFSSVAKYNLTTLLDVLWKEFQTMNG
ncbi:MAG: GTPase ObgE, partial [Ignavibacteriaceae bacterium]